MLRNNLVYFWIIVLCSIVVTSAIVSSKKVKYNAHLICSDRYLYRKSHSITILRQLDLFKLNVFDAVYPTQKIVDNKYECSLSIGKYGCNVSHRKVWKEIINNNNISNNEWVFIFEDDIDLPSNYTPYQIQLLMKKDLRRATRENADIIYFGHCFKHLCTHAYAVKKKSLQILYDNTYDCREEKPAVIDGQMKHAIINDNKLSAIYSMNAPKKTLNFGDGLIHQLNGSTIGYSYKESSTI